MGKNKFYSIKKIRAQNGSNAGRVDIYGIIDRKQFWGDEITPATFSSELEALGRVSELEVHIFSEGGDMFASLAIYSILKSRSEKKIIYVEGHAASGGSIITCAGDTVYMSQASMMFVHLALTNPGSVNENSARELLGDLEKYKEPMISAYMTKSGRTRDEVIALMNGASGNGTWLTASEAIEFGLADEYTPEGKLPLVAAACISPGIYNYRGYRIDFTGYKGFDEAAEKTAETINSNRGGNPMGIFSRKKKVAAKVNKPKAEAVFVEMVCPSCSGAINLNPETGETFVSVAKQSDQQGSGEGEPPKATLAKKELGGNVKASIYKVTCPHCGEDFMWDTDVNADGGEGQAVSDAVPIGGAKKTAQTPAQAPAQTPAQSTPAPSAEAVQAVCPNCSAAVPYDTETADTGTDDETGEEGYLLTCPECNTQFLEPFAASAPGAIPVATSAGIQAAYRAGVLAERNRQAALDEMALAAPSMADMIQAAKKSGASAETMSRNVIKAMAQGKGGASRSAAATQFAAALAKDIKTSNVNSMRTPAHAAAPKSIQASAYERRVEEHNKARGEVDNGKA